MDHKNGTVHFGGLKAESDQLSDHLASLAQRLSKACAMIQPAVNPTMEEKRLQVCSSSAVFIVMDSKSTHSDHLAVITILVILLLQDILVREGILFGSQVSA